MFRHSPVALTAAAIVTIALAAPAAAHVTVNPSQAGQGGFTKLAFRVPNERDDSGTVELEVTFPVDAPVAFVSVRKVPGWTVAVERATLPAPIEVHGEAVAEAVKRVTWTAQAGTRIGPGEFEEFEVSVGPLPEVDAMVFKARQTYESGEVVRWIEEPTGDEEPEHPAPVLTLTTGTGADPHTDGEPAIEVADEEDQDTATKALAIVGIGLGGAALAVGFAALNRAGRRPEPGV